MERDIRHRPELTEDHITLAREIVQQMLGDNFQIELEIMPKNVGVKGDEGVEGATALISGELERPAKFMIEEQDLLVSLVSRLTGEIYPITRVLFEITPGPNTPEPPPINSNYL